MKLRRLFALLLAAVMVFAMAACTPDTPDTPDQGDQPQNPNAELAGTYDIVMWVSELDGVAALFQTQIHAFEEANPGIVINAQTDANANKSYMAVLNDADGKTDEENSGALGYQTVYGLQYFNCGRPYFNADDPFNESNYNFTRDESRALFKLSPGEQKWVSLRIWLEGQDENCQKEIAGGTFNLVLKFDSAFVQ